MAKYAMWINIYIFIVYIPLGQIASDSSGRLWVDPNSNPVGELTINVSDVVGLLWLEVIKSH